MKLSKIFCIIAVFAMIVSMFAITASADVIELMKGTPDIDGVLDDIYLDSAVYEYKAEEAFGFFLLSDRGGAEGVPINIDMNAYMLYDKDFLYVCFVGYDDDPRPLSAKDDDYAKEDIYYRNDHIAFFFTINDVLEMVKTSFVAEFDIAVLTEGIDAEEFVSVGTMEDGHFVVEWAIPYTLNDGDVLKVNIEMADRISEEDFERSSYGVRHGQGYDYCDEFIVIGEYAVAAGESEEPEAPVEEPEAPVEEPEAPAEEPEAPAEEPEAPVEEPEVPVEEPEAPVEEPEAPVEEPEAPVEEPEAPVEEPEVPETFDASAVMYVLSAVAALGMGLVIRKRK